MDKRTKIIIGASVAAVAAYFLFFRKKEEAVDNTGVVSSSKGLSIDVAEPLGNGKGKWIGVPSKERGEVTEKLRLGTVATFNGSPCTVSKFWQDTNGYVGAIRCKEIAEGDYEVPEGSTLNW